VILYVLEPSVRVLGLKTLASKLIVLEPGVISDKSAKKISDEKTLCVLLLVRLKNKILALVFLYIYKANNLLKIFI
jgi:hypothetical protein